MRKCQINHREGEIWQTICHIACFLFTVLPDLLRFCCTLVVLVIVIVIVIAFVIVQLNQLNLTKRSEKSAR